ncbi:MAG: hypothetical protein DMG30_03695 [Acidobacteria bacterium]|nr:MAG: hypothetical protein DMG30_03695 [Acidobacteriota bacterium]
MTPLKAMRVGTSRTRTTKYSMPMLGGPRCIVVDATDHVFEDLLFRQLRFRAWLGSACKIVAKAPAAIRELERQHFDLVCLDHDLAINSGSGHDVATYLAEKKFAGTGVLIHSWNPVRSQRMEQTLRDAGVRVERIPFGMFAFLRSQSEKAS